MMLPRERVSRWRVSAGIVLITSVFLWLTWVRASAVTTEPESLVQEEELDEPYEMLRGMDTLISLDLRSTEASDALKYLATKGRLNIAISRNVAGRVSLFLTDVPIQDVFDLILRTNELAYDMHGDVYNIMTEVEYRALYGKRYADLREVRTIRLQYAIPSQAFNLLDTLKSEIGRLLVDEESGTVLMMDTPESLRKMEEALATLEQVGEVRIFDLKYADAIDIEAQLNARLEVNSLGFARADERSRKLIVKTLPDRMKEMEQLVEALDRKTREVLIDSRIIKVNFTKNLDTGIDWSQVFTNLKFHGVDTIGDFRTATTGTAPSEVPSLTRFDPEARFNSPLGERFRLGEFLFGTVSRDGYELLRYLETIGETKVISNPRILVTENEEARIHVGTREAYVTTTTTAGQTTTTTAENIEFIDVGILLVVTPTIINEDGFVTLKINPEVSSVVRTLTTPSNNQIPIVDTATAETTVVVKDGTTIVIGGLRKDESKSSTDEVPGLRRIPLLGRLFRQRDEDKELAELIVFITPHIVDGTKLVTGDLQSGELHEEYRDYGPVLSETPLTDHEP